MKRHEKKMEKPVSVRLMGSTKEALDKLVQREDRTLSYIIEREIRKALRLD